jgi:hypothetical protein
MQAPRVLCFIAQPGKMKTLLADNRQHVAAKDKDTMTPFV